VRSGHSETWSLWLRFDGLHCCLSGLCRLTIEFEIGPSLDERLSGHERVKSPGRQAEMAMDASSVL
jgi:hypothetical protein